MSTKIEIIAFFSAVLLFSNSLAFICPCKAFKTGETLAGYKIVSIEKQSENSNLIRLVPVKNTVRDANQATVNTVHKTMISSFTNRTGRSPVSIHCSDDDSVKKGGISCIVKR